MRMMMCVCAMLATLATLPGTGRADEPGEIPSYYQHLDFNLTSPTAMATATGGFANPAVYAMLPGWEVEYSFADPRLSSDTKRWGLFWGLGNVGFGSIHRSDEGIAGHTSITDYQLALSVGTRASTFGLALRWSSGDTDFYRRTKLIQVGSVERINRFVSIGMAGAFSTENADQSGLFDLAIRPFGTSRFTAFGDFELPRGVNIEDAPWSAGVVLELVPGVRFTGRGRRDDTFAVGLTWVFGGTGGGHASLTGSPQLDKDDEAEHTNWTIRLGYPQRNAVVETIMGDDSYLYLPLKGRIVHRRFKYFDNGITLSDVLSALEGARTDRRISGVALNLSGAQLSRGHAWEIRRKLEQIKAAGKRVVIFIDDCGMTSYHLASVADHVVMDPEGLILLPGYARSRTYIARMIEKMGLGAEEWRFKDYKSAMEFVTRRGMSDEDREQRQALVDEYYETMRSDVAASRGVEPATFDRWVDDVTVISAKTAIDEGLIDETGRWEDATDIIKRLEGGRRWSMAPGSLTNKAYPPTGWGTPPRIALLYAIGVCDLDSGIRARWLSRKIREYATDRSVKAVVLRVNSPGGSGMASDHVAEAIRFCTERKPVIVSMGDVAASGGYWLSMYATEILVEPTTITGSIGVIGGWVWDNGMSDKVGLDHDFVKRGKSADIFSLVQIPFTPLGVPHRSLTDEERKEVLTEMEESYDGFVAKVAQGRDLSRDRVESLAKGRVWTGMAAVENGLADRVGGLDDALRLAREMTGLEGREVEILDHSVRGLFNPDVIKVMPFFARSVDSQVDASAFDFLFNYETSYLHNLVESRGRPLYMLPPEDMVPEE